MVHHEQEQSEASGVRWVKVPLRALDPNSYMNAKVKSTPDPSKVLINPLQSPPNSHKHTHKNITTIPMKRPSPSFPQVLRRSLQDESSSSNGDGTTEGGTDLVGSASGDRGRAAGWGRCNSAGNSAGGGNWSSAAGGDGVDWSSEGRARSNWGVGWDNGSSAASRSRSDGCLAGGSREDWSLA